MKNGISNTLTKLGYLAKSVQEARNDSEFFRLMAIFLRRFVEDPEFYGPFDPYWRREKDKDTNKLNELGKKLTEDVEQVKKEIDSVVGDAKKYPNISNQFDTLDGLISGRLTMSGDYVTNVALYTDLTLSFMAEYPDLQDFRQKYSVLNDRGDVVDWKWSENHEAYKAEKQMVDRITPSSSWGVWEDMSNFYVIYYQYEKEFDKIKKKNRMMELFGLAEAYKELTDVLDNKNIDEKKYLFDPDHYKSAFMVFSYHLFLAHTSTSMAPTTDNQTSQKYQNDQLTAEVTGKHGTVANAHWLNEEKGILIVGPDEREYAVLANSKLTEAIKKKIINSASDPDRKVVKRIVVKAILNDFKDNYEKPSKDKFRRYVGKEFLRVVGGFNNDPNSPVCFKTDNKDGVYTATWTPDRRN